MKRIQPGLKVLINGTPAGSVGEKISLAAGEHTVLVKAHPFFTCRPEVIELKPGTITSLDYTGSRMAWGSVALGFALFMFLSFPSLFLLDQLKRLIGGNNVPWLEGLVLLVAIILGQGWLAFAAPLRLLAIFGIYSHTLCPSGKDALEMLQTKPTK